MSLKWLKGCISSPFGALRPKTGRKRQKTQTGGEAQMPSIQCIGSFILWQLALAAWDAAQLEVGPLDLLQRHLEIETPEMRRLKASPMFWLHIPKCGTSFYNTLVHLPGNCPGWPVNLSVGDEFFRKNDPKCFEVEARRKCPEWCDQRLLHCDGPLLTDTHELLGLEKYQTYKGKIVAIFRQPEQRFLSSWYDDVDLFRADPSTWVCGTNITPGWLMDMDEFKARWVQLYDLVDLLPEKPQLVRSLRLALSLQEIEKLRKTADLRPTTYHSSVAVLIIADKENPDIVELKNFFKGLNSKSDVTIINCENALRTELDINRRKFPLRHTITDDGEVKVILLGEQNEIQQQQEFQEEIGKKEKELQKEIENITTSISAVIDSWIHNQGNFSLFAVFQFSKFSDWAFDLSLESIMEKLVSGILDKIKLIIGPRPMRGLEPSTDTFKLVTGLFPLETFLVQLLKILNKRWQTLDLISMMKELKRTSFVYGVPVYQIIDRLSSVPRFKKE